MDFSIVYDDIAQQTADVLVSAATTNLQMDGAVADTLQTAATGPLTEAAAAEAPVALGDVAVTDAYGLDAEYVIHAAATPSYGSQQASGASIRAATKAALSTADSLDCESLVIPVIGTGTAGFEFTDGARIVCDVVSGYESSSLVDVRLITNLEQEYDYLERIVSSR
ncbi:macro domain-containing protein [Haloarcula nitratireducens]|uniref:Macro domain-containing protein n=1 Tax=Haloarcula nitratireducens TaxID=2487749 RepID=A0AAW4PKU0_9EURY|nr:macro domain-containing protein [Halomicroarcula nitratireducens]MBX0298046.1 macro domain-containing protein [Halomicroarcula nitratireducens]